MKVSAHEFTNTHNHLCEKLGQSKALENSILPLKTIKTQEMKKFVILQALTNQDMHHKTEMQMIALNPFRFDQSKLCQALRKR